MIKKCKKGETKKNISCDYKTNYEIAEERHNIAGQREQITIRHRHDCVWCGVCTMNFSDGEERERKYTDKCDIN